MLDEQLTKCSHSVCQSPSPLRTSCTWQAVRNPAWRPSPVGKRSPGDCGEGSAGGGGGGGYAERTNKGRVGFTFCRVFFLQYLRSHSSFARSSLPAGDSAFLSTCRTGRRYLGHVLTAHARLQQEIANYSCENGSVDHSLLSSLLVTLLLNLAAIWVSCSSHWLLPGNLEIQEKMQRI